MLQQVSRWTSTKGAIFRIVLIVSTIVLGVSLIHAKLESTPLDLANHVKSALVSFHSESRLAIVMPFTAADVEHELSNLELWRALGRPTTSALTRGRVDLVFLYNLGPDEHSLGLLNSPRFKESWDILSMNFGTVKIIYANLTPEEDIYPAGPSNMFFKLFLDKGLQTQLAEYSNIYWMEWDVFPIRQGWVSKLYDETLTLDPFWMRGSIYLGRAFDDTVQYAFNHGWVTHINGNALYPAHDPDFKVFLETVMDQEPPNHFWKPFDVSIAKVFHHLPYAWQWQQKFAGRFQYSEFVLHYGFTIEDSQIEEALENPNVYLIHGKKTSAGNVKYVEKFDKNNTAELSVVDWTDNSPLSMNVSALLRTYSKDIDFVGLAIESIVRYLAIIEIVMVVPEDELDLFTSKTWHPLVKVVGEPKVLPNGDIQQKYTKLTADLYCRGAYIFHLDSDSILFRPVLKKDIWWRGRPSLHYTPYSDLTAAQGMWRLGTTNALQREAEFEFSRTAAHVYPREAYALAREFIKTEHQKTLVDFLATKTGKNAGIGVSDAEASEYFSDYNFLGGVLYYLHNDLMTWIPTSAATRNSGVYPIIPVYICQGNGRKSVEAGPDYKAKMLRLMREGMKTGSCAAIDAYVKELEALKITW